LKGREPRESSFDFPLKGDISLLLPLEGEISLLLPLQGGGWEGDGMRGIKRMKFSTIRLPRVVKIDSG
jgi:hypothetical protein